jgi:hypothetical protein
VDSDSDRALRVQGYRDELLQCLRLAYEQRRSVPDHALHLLRQAAEGLCYCTLLGKNRVGLEQHFELGELIRRATPFLKDDADALHGLREWGNRASHAQGRPRNAGGEEATAMFLLTAKPMRWLYREILHEEVPADLEERYGAIMVATRVAPAVRHVSRGGAGGPGGNGNANAPTPSDATTARDPRVAGGARHSSVVRSVPLLLASLLLVVVGLSVTYAIMEKNDGTDASRPVLPERDNGFVDIRGGWGWGDKCWLNIKAGKWGWAKAECDEGMRMNPVSPQPMASLLYNEGLIAKAMGKPEEARARFSESLALREHPEVRAALNALP